MKIVWACSLLLAVAGCSASDQPPPETSQAAGAPASSATVAQAANGIDTSQGGQSGANAVTKSDAGADSDDGWELSDRRSPMDGQLVRAARTYTVPDIDTTVEAEFVCTVQKKQLQIKLSSYVGSTSHPSESSAFQFEQIFGTRLFTPKGRIKFSSNSPEKMGTSFGVRSDVFESKENFANVITMNLDTKSVIDSFVTEGVPPGLLGAYVRLLHMKIDRNKLESPPFSTNAGYSDIAAYNGVAALARVFPIAVEAINGNGTFDIVIDKSAPIEAVLESCGGDGRVIDPALLITSTDSPANGASGTDKTDAVAGQPTPAEATSTDGRVAQQAPTPQDALLRYEAGMQQPTSATSSAGDTVAQGVLQPPVVNQFHPSFDCAKASARVEHMICSSEELAAQDQVMVVAYKTALASSTDKAKLKQAQVTWMTQVRNACADAACVLAAYNARDAQLNGH